MKKSEREANRAAKRKISLLKKNVEQIFGLKSSSRIKTSKLKSRRSVIIVHLHIAIVRILRKALIVMQQGRYAKIILDINCFRVSLL